MAIYSFIKTLQLANNLKKEYNFRQEIIIISVCHFYRVKNKSFLAQLCLLIIIQPTFPAQTCKITASDCLQYSLLSFLVLPSKWESKHKDGSNKEGQRDSEISCLVQLRNSETPGPVPCLKDSVRLYISSINCNKSSFKSLSSLLPVITCHMRNHACYSTRAKTQ